MTTHSQIFNSRKLNNNKQKFKNLILYFIIFHFIILIFIRHIKIGITGWNSSIFWYDIHYTYNNQFALFITGHLHFRSIVPSPGQEGSVLLSPGQEGHSFSVPGKRVTPTQSRTRGSLLLSPGEEGQFFSVPDRRVTPTQSRTRGSLLKSSREDVHNAEGC